MQLWTYFTKQWQHRVQLGFLLRLGQGVRRRDVLVEQLLEVGQAQQLLFFGPGYRGDRAAAAVTFLGVALAGGARASPDQKLSHDIHLGSEVVLIRPLDHSA